VVAGHDEAIFVVATVEADGPTLGLVEASGAFPDGENVGGTGEQAVGDEAEHGHFGIPPRVDAAVVGNEGEAIGEASQVLGVESTTGSSNRFGGRFLVNLGKFGGAGEEGAGFFVQGVNPVFFGAFGVLVEVAFVAPVSFAEAQGSPVAGFVDGAFVVLWVAEAFGKQRAVSIFLLEVLGEVAQGEAHAAGGEVGLALGVEDEEAAKLGHQGETVGAGERIPVDPFVAVFEPESGSRPAKHGAKDGKVLVGAGAVDALPDGVASGASDLEVMLAVEGLTELIDLKRCGGRSDFEGLSDRVGGRANRGLGDHD